MGRYRALLVGASDYRSSQGQFPSLDFIPDELALLRTVLLARGFHQVDIVARGYVPDTGTGINRSQVRGSVNQALDSAGMGDTLLVVLSGHGIQHNGRDYLVPEGLHPYDSQVDESVAIDWARAVSGSDAGTVVFLMDTCREGVREEYKGGPRLERRAKDLDWRLDQRRKVALVFACSPLETALWSKGDVTADGADAPSFSLFTRALTELVRDHGSGMTLAQLLESLQGRITELHTLCGKSGRPQRVDDQITSRHAHHEIAVLPAAPGAEEAPARSYADHPWVGIVTGHVAWSLVPDPQPSSVVALKEHCAAVAARLAAEYDRHEPQLRDDPWHDPSHAERASSQLAQLLTGGPSAERHRPLTVLSATEAALLALTPFVTHTAQARLAATESGALKDSPPQFTTFTEQYPRERRRMKQAERAGNSAAVAQIQWWLFHRWLLHRGESYQPSVVDCLLPDPQHGLPDWVAQALGPGRLIRFFNELRLVPFALPGSPAGQDDGPGPEEAPLRVRDVVAPAHTDQHDVRERLMGTLLKLAQACAVDPLALPQVVVQNLGIRNQVDLADLRTQLQQAYWTPSGKGITLHATTNHHVLALALETYCDQVDGLLRDIGEQADLAKDLRPLEALPARAGTDLDAPAHLREAVRFRADEERVLDLLMGRNLYKDPGLAVRELYQNAMDACRHRALRTEYLRRTGKELPEWEGLITFTQGVDAKGRRFLRCEDTGIGMGVNEIRNAFAEAGARFVHLPEYVREMALWQQHAKDLKLYPNSRFGIGVLSYFMLADEITVETCRLGMNGRPGPGLRVDIAGPGTLFRINPLPVDPGRGAGTAVTLYLNPPDHDEPPLSCLDVLEQQLWIAPFKTVVSNGGTPVEWEAYQLRLQTFHEYQMANAPRSGRLNHTPSQVAQASDGRLHWVEGDGILLADGIRTNSNLFGMVIDLRDELRPELLSVDRVDLRRYDEDAVGRLKRESIPALIDSPVFTYEWATALAYEDEKLATACVEHASEDGISWVVSGQTMPVAATGIFPLDKLILRAITGERLNKHSSEDDDDLVVGSLPDHVIRWRLLSLLRSGVGGPVADTVAPSAPLTAHPPDLSVLLPSDNDGIAGWQMRRDAWLSKKPIAGESLSPPLTAAGLDTIDVLPRWRDQEKDFGLSEILYWVGATGRTATEVTQRLTSLGLRAAPLGVVGHAGREDLPYLRRVSAYSDYISPEVSVSWPQLVFSAAHAGSSLRDAAQRLTQLGYEMPVAPGNHVEPGEGDLRLLRALYTKEDRSSHEDRSADENRPLSVARISVAAASTRTSPAEVAERLVQLGIEVPSHAFVRAPIPDSVQLILSQDLDSRGPWLSPEHDIPPPHVIAASRTTGLSTAAVSEALRTHGFTPPENMSRWEAVSDEDLQLLSSNYDRKGDYLHPDEPVTLPHLLSCHRDFDLPLEQVRRRFTDLGYTVPPAHPLLDTLSPEEFSRIRRFIPDARGANKTTDVVPPSHIRAAARRLGRPATEIAQNLAALGCQIGAPVESFADPAPGELLTARLSPVDDTSDARPHEGTHIPLAELAAVAVRLARPFREIALEATRHGFRHEAETWFEEVEQKDIPPG